MIASIKSLGGEGETYIYYIAIQMGVFMIALEKLVCFCPIRPVFIAKLRLPIDYPYYLMVPTVKDYEQDSIRFV